jgi:hypothetical protein
MTMALKFLYITKDPFVNNSEEFVRILAIVDFPSSMNGFVFAGSLYDQSGNIAANMYGSYSQLSTDSTAYPYTLNGSYSAQNIIIIPPGWSFKSFGAAIAVQGSLEEVLRVH